MTDITAKLAEALKALLPEAINDRYVTQSPAVERARDALTAYTASQSEPEFGPLDPRVHDLGKWEPARDEALEALLAKALRRLAFWAQTSGGTAGRDDGLVAAIDVGLAALRQYDTKLAQEPR